MKKVFSAVVALFMLLLCGCSALSTSLELMSTPTPTPYPTQTARQIDISQTSIAVLLPGATESWVHAAQYYAQEALAQLGAQYNIMFADNPQLQSEQIQQTITDAYDVVILLPVDASVAESAKSITKAGLGLILFDRKLASAGETCFVCVDNAAIGKYAAEYTIEKLEGTGKIAIIGVPGAGVQNTQRIDAFKNGIAAASDGEIEILQEFAATAASSEQGKTIWNSILALYPDVNAVFTTDDSLALGVYQQASTAGHALKVIMGVGASQNSLNAMSTSVIELATLTNSPKEIVRCVEAAQKLILEGALKDKAITYPTQLVTKSNVQEFLNPQSIY